MRNITLGATYSVLCSTAHKTDAATGEHGDLLDVIAMSCGLDRLARRRSTRHVRFLSLPRPEPKPRGTSASTGARADRRNPHDGCSRYRSRLRARSRKRICAVAALRLCTEPAALRFHPRCYYRPDADAPTETWPAMIAAVTDLDGTHHRRAPHLARPVRRRQGADRHAAARNGPSARQCASASVLASDVMAAGEGIETMLSLRCVLPTMPMVAALSANHLAAILFPATLRRLYIARDDDPAGDVAMATLTERARAAGIEAITLSPTLGDFNEDLRTLGIDDLRAALRVQLAPEDVARFMEPTVEAGTDG